ncbi:MAG: hypothetical protein KBT39_10010, partial [Bacteroidales bacterium]|nr:hypothetical protein [Bacteroidales bacterium]
VFNKDKSGQKSLAYVLRPVRYSTMRANDIVNYCATNSIVPKAYVHAAMIALSQCVENFLLNGHSVEFPNLGIFSLSSQGITESDAEKAGVDQLIKLRVRFLPCTELKTLMDNVEVEFDGVYDIAGEDKEGGKFYRKVARKLTVMGEDDVNPDGGGDVPSGGSNGGQQSGGSTSRQYTISVQSANTAQGTVTGGGTYSEGSRVNITATPKSGYQFDKWSDGNASSTRTIQVSKNESFVAQFKAAEQTGGDGTNTGDEDDEHL